ncbi:2-methylisocitrate lyase-like PEP mutase family enzyme [Nonomuraea fuscirosea]|uniref:2-methylisocitrate lyase-like PEP mutase family enzyme n=2 Tax=Nonomuraea fuscirosea TaxID=1291556 RepID=A0A2T0LLZ0_9ACTN|nr:isocitrate lyase/phosphoenolpyruvate mutase family protein [Nonomuraea fuscirosea]PRX44047.1 2-methylisocitrate lyase-like PEP mutase family enzyme [Nonomuraea fuscirosea]
MSDSLSRNTSVEGSPTVPIVSDARQGLSSIAGTTGAADQRAATTPAPDKATMLRALHVMGAPVVIPNAWDAASARMVEAAGFSAVATSSAATSQVLGFEDGEAAPVQDILDAARRMVQAVRVPVTVDFERGYGLEPTELVERFAATGAVGLNLEDSDPASGQLLSVDEQAEFLAAVRQAARSSNVDLVINARTDAFLRRVGTPEEQLATTLERGKRYLEAGADCVYPLGVGDPSLIRTLVGGIPGPLNVAYGRGAHSLADLASFGVARITFGPMFQRHLYSMLESTLLPALAANDNPFA